MREQMLLWSINECLIALCEFLIEGKKPEGPVGVSITKPNKRWLTDIAAVLKTRVRDAMEALEEYGE